MALKKIVNTSCKVCDKSKVPAPACIINDFRQLVGHSIIFVSQLMVMPHRRRVIQQLFWGGLTLCLLPACSTHSEPRFQDGKLILSEADYRNLKALCFAILPHSEEMQLNFALRMINDCLGPKEQKRFLEGMKAFYAACHATYGKAFEKTASAEKESLIRLAGQNTLPEECTYFYKTLRTFVVKGYQGGAYYGTQIHPYQMIPGRYEGCATING